MKPFENAVEAWQSLLDQSVSSHPEIIDLVEHGFQCAEQLELRGCDDEMVVAGLLHDLGDGRVSALEHASFAADLVRPLFGDRVAWLIAAHADAKRYLCTTDRPYFDTLSPTSQRTMMEQGGFMSPEEVAAFDAHPWVEDALTLRLCDDAAKRPDYLVENPERFLITLERLAGAVS